MLNKYINSCSIKVDNNELEIIDKYIYLGWKFTMNNDIMTEILNHTKLGWRKFGQLNIVFKSNMPFCLKRKLFDQCVLPVLTYDCETWTLNSKSIQKLNTTQWSMDRQILNITQYRKWNIWIRNQTKVCTIMKWIASKKWQWAGYMCNIARRKYNRGQLKF